MLTKCRIKDTKRAGGGEIGGEIERVVQSLSGWWREKCATETETTQARRQGGQEARRQGG